MENRLKSFYKNVREITTQGKKNRTEKRLFGWDHKTFGSYRVNQNLVGQQYKLMFVLLK